MAKQSAKEYWDRRLERHWGLEGVGSLAYGRHYNRWLYRVRRRVFADVCASLDVDWLSARVLDVGCGTGFYLDLWRERGVAALSGLDFSPVAIERLGRNHPGIELLEADIGAGKPPFPASCFEIVSAFDVLFHIVDDERYRNALRNAHAMLASGGLLLYSDNFIRSGARQHEDYWKSRSLGQIEIELDRAGFDIVERRPVFVLMGSPVDSESRVWRGLWDLAMRAVARSEAIGFAAGAVLYPWELALGRALAEGPSTEIAICRKR